MPKKKQPTPIIPPPSLRRVVTTCWAYDPPYSQRSFDSSAIGLLFHKEEKVFQSNEVVSIMTHPLVRKLFGDTFFGGMVECGQPSRYWRRDPDVKDAAFMVTATVKYLPHAGNEDYEMLFLLHDDQLYAFTVGDMYDACWRMAKFRGCKECDLFKKPGCFISNFPTESARCLWNENKQLTLIHRLTGLQADAFDDLPDPDGEEWKDLKLKNWIDQVAGFTVIPAAATKDLPATPGPSMGEPAHYMFNDLSGAREALSDRSVSGAKTRHHIRTECARCHFGGTNRWGGKKTCGKYWPRWCEHGAWLGEEHLADYTLMHVQRALQEHDWTLEDLWRVAYASGYKFKRKDEQTGRPREWVIAGIQEDHASGGARLNVIVNRTARNSRGVAFKAYTMDMLRRFVSDDINEMMYQAPEINRVLLALWCHLAITRVGRTYSFCIWSEKKGFQGYGWCQRHVVWVAMETNWRNEVRVCYGTTKDEDQKTFSDFDDVFCHFGNLPFFDVHKEETFQRTILSGNVR